MAALDASDRRSHEVRVAGTAALVVAKMHKIGERAKDKPDLLEAIGRTGSSSEDCVPF